MLAALVLMVALAAAPEPPQRDEAASRVDHLSLSVSPFAGYLSQLDVRATLLLLQPFIIEAMGFRAIGSFWPAPGSLPRDGAGVAAGARSLPLIATHGFELSVAGLIGYRFVLLDAYAPGKGEPHHGLSCEGTIEAVYRVHPRVAMGLKGVAGLLFFPAQKAPYFNYRLDLPFGGFAPEWQLAVEVVL